jgi:hypothetical protein
MPHFEDSIINENLSVATEYFRALISQKGENKNFAGSIGFIPFNINFTIDGLSGIKIYNELHVDTSFLPPGYTKTTDFIITGIDHNIQNGDWETNITTTLIPKTSPITNVITSSLTFASQAEEARVDTPPTAPSPSTNVPSSAINTNSSEGDPNGVYISPARKADKGDGTNYVDVSKTLSSKSLKSLAEINGGLYPIRLYTKPGDSSGTKYAKVIGFIGQRNSYEPDPTFNSNNIISWTYTGKNGFKQSAKLNKTWGPTLTKIAETLDSKGMWDSKHIKSWSAGIVLRDVTPASGISYGTISAHAFGMAIDINSGQYPLGSTGVATWKSDFAANIPTALVHNVIQTNFVLNQGGPQKVFWLLDSGDAHHFSVFKKV